MTGYDRSAGPRDAAWEPASERLLRKARGEPEPEPAEPELPPWPDPVFGIDAYGSAR